jgi:hypothetical protein
VLNGIAAVGVVTAMPVEQARRRSGGADSDVVAALRRLEARLAATEARIGPPERGGEGTRSIQRGSWQVPRGKR